MTCRYNISYVLSHDQTVSYSLTIKPDNLVRLYLAAICLTSSVTALYVG